MYNIELAIEQTNGEPKVLASEIPGPGRYMVEGGIVQLAFHQQSTDRLTGVSIDCSEAPILQDSQQRVSWQIELQDGIGRAQINNQTALVVKSLP